MSYVLSKGGSGYASSVIGSSIDVYFSYDCSASSSFSTTYSSGVSEDDDSSS